MRKQQFLLFFPSSSFTAFTASETPCRETRREKSSGFELLFERRFCEAWGGCLAAGSKYYSRGCVVLSLSLSPRNTLQCVDCANSATSIHLGRRPSRSKICSDGTRWNERRYSVLNGGQREGGGSRLFFKFSTTRRRDRRRRDVLSARRIRGPRFTIAFLRPRSYLLRSSLPFKTRIRSPVTRNRDGISFDDSHAPGLFSFLPAPLLPDFLRRVSSLLPRSPCFLRVRYDPIEISSIPLRGFFPLRIEQSSRNSSRILERVDRRFERFQGRSGLTGEEACKRCRKAREKCEEEGIGVTTPTGRVHFPRRGGVDSLCVCLAGPGPRFLESRTWNS